MTTIQPIDILHHLFSRGCTDLKSPHECLGWSIPKYALWLDSARNSDLFTVIQNSLETYAKLVNARGEKQYTPIYPIIMDLAPKLLKVTQKINKQTN